MAGGDQGWAVLLGRRLAALDAQIELDPGLDRHRRDLEAAVLLCDLLLFAGNPTAVAGHQLEGRLGAWHATAALDLLGHESALVRRLVETHHAPPTRAGARAVAVALLVAARGHLGAQERPRGMAHGAARPVAGRLRRAGVILGLSGSLGLGMAGMAASLGVAAAPGQPLAPLVETFDNARLFLAGPGGRAQAALEIAREKSSAELAAVARGDTAAAAAYHRLAAAWSARAVELGASPETVPVPAGAAGGGGTGTGQGGGGRAVPSPGGGGAGTGQGGGAAGPGQGGGGGGNGPGGGTGAGNGHGGGGPHGATPGTSPSPRGGNGGGSAASPAPDASVSPSPHGSHG